MSILLLISYVRLHEGFMHFLNGLLPIPAIDYFLKKRYLDVYGLKCVQKEFRQGEKLRMYSNIWGTLSTHYRMNT
jgi:hypothetical protein